MSIYALIVTRSLNCFASKARQTKVLPARTVTMTLNEYSPLAPLFLEAAKGRLNQLGEVPLVAHALPQAVVPAKHSSCSRKLRRAPIIENTR